MAVVAMAVLASTRLVGIDDVREIVALPPTGSVLPAVLEDGTPVLVTHPARGDPQVFDAVAPETEGAVVALVAWCPRGDRFVAAHHGLSYAPDGSPYAQRGPGRFLPVGAERTGLGGRAVIDVAGRGAAGDPIQLGPGLNPVRGLPVDTAITGTPAECTLGSFRAPAGAGPVDHSSLTTSVLDVAVDGWQMVVGVLAIDPDGAATWCDSDQVVEPDDCRRPSDVPVRLGVGPVQTGGVAATIAGPMGLRLQDGAITQVGVMLSTSWRGPSLEGVDRYDGVWSALTGGLGLRLVPPPDTDSACLSPWRQHASTSRPDGAIQSVGPDTRFDVGGQTDPAALTLADLAGSPVEVTVDAASCIALAVQG